MSIQSRVPAEVQDAIFDYLPRDDSVLREGTLRACTTVCKAWYARAQCHLFYRVLLLAGPSGSGRNEETAFLEHLETYPHLRRYVRDFELFGLIRGAVLAKLVRQLSALQHLKLPEDIRVWSCHDPEDETCIDDLLTAVLSLKSLRTLHLHATFQCEFDDGRADADFLASTAGLHLLRSLDAGEYDPTTVRIVAMLRAAVVQAQNPSSGGTPPLRHFGVVLYPEVGDFASWEEERASKNRVMDSFGRSLEHLTLKLFISEEFRVGEVIPKLHLSACVALRTLELEVRWTYTENDQEDSRYRALDAAAAVISSLSPLAPVEHVLLGVESDDRFLRNDFGPVGDDDIYREALGTLEDKLCDSLPRLKLVTLANRAEEDDVYIGWDPESMHACMAENFQRLRNKEELTFACTAFGPEFVLPSKENSGTDGDASR